MSGIFPTVVLPRDLRVLKERVQPQVTWIDARVQQTPALDAASREAWQTFAAQWRDFVASADDQSTGAKVDAGEVLERTLRDLKSLLSSQCFGVPTPARKRDVSFLPTWVTPSLVRDQKQRVAPRVRELGAKVAQAAALPDAARAAWVQFARAWASFESDAEEWTHCAAQYANALAFEDVLPEWSDAIAMLAGSDASATSSPGTSPPWGVAPPGAPGFPMSPGTSGPEYPGPPVRPGASPARAAGRSGVPVIAIAAAVAVGALVLMGAKR